MTDAQAVCVCGHGPDLHNEYGCFHGMCRCEDLTPASTGAKGTWGHHCGNVGPEVHVPLSKACHCGMNQESPGTGIRYADRSEYADRGEVGEANPIIDFMKSMSPEEEAILDELGNRDLEHAATWCTGRKVGRTIYAGDTLIGVMDRVKDAELVVRAVNAMRGRELKNKLAERTKDESLPSPEGEGGVK